jgi:hypothetical protein|tara:strand:+ start:147 stop:491 length:345 start_codon:yes stop_codon:yes gene_type:complete
MELLTFILCAYGLTQILVYGDLPLLKSLRPSKEALKGYGKVFHCPMCMGFHVGWFLMLLSPFTELFNFDVSVINYFLLGSLSSGTSYILNMVFGDDGIQLKKNYKVESFFGEEE